MTPHTIQVVGHNLQTELERLAYSAYLLTLDPGVALSVVMTAVDESLEESSHDLNLLERTVELSLQQLRRDSTIGWDGESSVFDVALYGHSTAMNSQTLQLLKDLSSSPIVMLDSNSRITFVLHHVLGYKIREAAAKRQVSETEYGAQLNNAYLQLASFQLGNKSSLMRDVGDSAQA
jgi:hypothetical protein